MASVPGDNPGQTPDETPVPANDPGQPPMPAEVPVPGPDYDAPDTGPVELPPEP